MNINRVTIRNISLSFQINVFDEKFADMQMISLINFFSKYDQLPFDKRNRNFIEFITFFELSRIIIFFQNITNFVEQFVRIANHILNVYILEKSQTFVNNIAVKNDRNNYDNKKIVFEIRISVFRHV